jgi:hypothetical protein
MQPGRAMPLGLAIVLGAGCAGDCGGEREEPARRVSIEGVRFHADGVSQAIRVQVPERTRALAVVVRGDDQTLYGLAWLETADGIEHVRLPDRIDLGVAMRRQYLDDGVGAMPGALFQRTRLGTFTLVFPDRPGVGLPPGEAVLRIATTDPTREPVEVEILLPPDDGARVLPLNVFAVSNQFSYAGPESVPFVAGLREILGAAGIEIAVEQVVNLPDSGLSRMSEATRPQELPDSGSAKLALLGGAMVPGDALNLFIVDAMPAGIAGWSLGTPGPPLPDTCYSGVVASHAEGDRLPLVLAHEVAHYLGLAHPVDTAPSGATYPDPLEDTEPGGANLMSGEGVALTRDQAWVLGRSPLLR